MRNIKLFIIVGILSFVCAGAIITCTTSCNKVTCSNVICQNGGSCSDGKCTCPTGYSGTFCEVKAKTGIKYQNNTYTPITITVNGDGRVIPVGGTQTFIGEVGSVATGSASTAGSASTLGVDNAGGILGLEIDWSINNPFPETDTLTVPLNVGNTYFFLRLVNTGSKNIIHYYVNADFSYGSYSLDATIPNDHNTYDMGYYLAYPGANAYIIRSDLTKEEKFFTLPDVINQSVTVTF